MFNVSWGEMLLIGAVALIVIGPRELPATLRTVGRMIAKVRRMAAEFQGHFAEALREADLDKVRKDVESMDRATSFGFDPMKPFREDVRGTSGESGAKTTAAGTSASSTSISNEPAPMPLKVETKAGAEPMQQGRNLT